MGHPVVLFYIPVILHRNRSTGPDGIDKISVTLTESDLDARLMSSGGSTSSAASFTSVLLDGLDPTSGGSARALEPAEPRLRVSATVRRLRPLLWRYQVPLATNSPQHLAHSHQWSPGIASRFERDALDLEFYEYSDNVDGIGTGLGLVKKFRSQQETILFYS